MDLSKEKYDIDSAITAHVIWCKMKHLFFKLVNVSTGRFSVGDFILHDFIGVDHIDQSYVPFQNFSFYNFPWIHGCTAQKIHIWSGLGSKKVRCVLWCFTFFILFYVCEHSIQ